MNKNLFNIINISSILTKYQCKSIEIKEKKKKYNRRRRIQKKFNIEKVDFQWLHFLQKMFYWHSRINRIF